MLRAAYAVHHCTESHEFGGCLRQYLKFLLRACSRQLGRDFRAVKMMYMTFVRQPHPHLVP